MLRAELLPEAPPDLASDRIEIEYVSPLAKAQKQSEVQGVVRMIEMMQPIASLDPAALDHIDTDGLARHVINVLGVPASVVRGGFEVQMIREQRAQQQQQQAAMQQEMAAAEAAGKAAPAVKAAADLPAEMGAPPLEVVGG